MHGPSSLLEVHELLALLPHHACGDVVGAKSIAELRPRHLVIRGASGGVVDSPRADVTPQLLRDEEGLLHLGAGKSPNLDSITRSRWSAARCSPVLVKSSGCVAAKSL
jgi:hypothetical protein